ncbi:MAG: FxLYD domain-containing protein [Oscillospiraceae bacterium]
MKSKLNTILQLVIIVLLAVVIALQVFNISNKDADSDDFVEKNLSQQKQWTDYQKEVGKKNITVTNDKISRGDYSTSIIGDVTNTSNKTVSGVSVNITLYKDNNEVDTTHAYIGDMSPNSTRKMEATTYSVDFDSYTIDYVTGTIYD